MNTAVTGMYIFLFFCCPHTNSVESTRGQVEKSCVYILSADVFIYITVQNFFRYFTFFPTENLIISFLYSPAFTLINIFFNGCRCAQYYVSLSIFDQFLLLIFKSVKSDYFTKFFIHSKFSSFLFINQISKVSKHVFS